MSFMLGLRSKATENANSRRQELAETSRPHSIDTEYHGTHIVELSSKFVEVDGKTNSTTSCGAFVLCVGVTGFNSKSSDTEDGICQMMVRTSSNVCVNFQHVAKKVETYLSTSAACNSRCSNSVMGAIKDMRNIASWIFFVRSLSVNSAQVSKWATDPLLPTLGSKTSKSCGSPDWIVRLAQ